MSDLGILGVVELVVGGVGVVAFGVEALFFFFEGG